MPGTSRRRQYPPKTEEQKKLARAARRKRHAEYNRQRKNLPGSSYPYPPLPIEKIDRISDDAWKYFQFLVSRIDETGKAHSGAFLFNTTGFSRSKRRELRRELVAAELVTWFSDLQSHQAYYRIVPPDETAQRKAA